jgi:hypothetical protein
MRSKEPVAAMTTTSLQIFTARLAGLSILASGIGMFIYLIWFRVKQILEGSLSLAVMRSAVGL